jgi:hypothetical protein
MRIFGNIIVISKYGQRNHTQLPCIFEHFIATFNFIIANFPVGYKIAPWAVEFIVHTEVSSDHKLKG